MSYGFLNLIFYDEIKLRYFVLAQATMGLGVKMPKVAF